MRSELDGNLLWSQQDISRPHEEVAVWVGWQDLLLVRSIAAQVAVSQFVAERIDGKARVIYAGVDIQTAVSVRRRRLILVAQRLSEEKATSDAIYAMKRSGLGDSGWVMWIAGRGVQRAFLEGLIETLGMQQCVKVIGFRDDLGVLMQEAGIVLATAPAEPFGLTVVEAMARATPVVAAKGGGHLESVGRAARPMLYVPGDIEGAASQLNILAHSPSRRGSYGRELQKIQRENFTPMRQAEDTERLYREVLARA